MLTTCESTRPIIFVAHSLGGLVCANALASHYGSDAYGEEVVENTCGTIFLGTPFKGSDKAAWAKMAERVLGMFGDSNDQTIKDLDKRSTKLQQISVDFHMLLQKRYASKELRPIQVACFFEQKTTAKTWRKVKKDLGQIVTADSATLAGYKPIGISADHITMCKFPDVQTPGYKDVTGMMKLMISNLDKKIEDMNVWRPHS
jgi:protein SERAC1